MPAGVPLGVRSQGTSMGWKPCSRSQVIVRCYELMLALIAETTVARLQAAHSLQDP
jgi:hypothetical protein